MINNPKQKAVTAIPYGIMGSIIIILLFIIGFMYLRRKYPKMTLTKEAPEVSSMEG